MSPVGVPLAVPTAVLAAVLATTLVVGFVGCQRSHLSPSSVEVAVLTAPDMLKQLESGDIDGFVSWEPFPSVAVSAGYGKILEVSTDIWPDHPCCVLAVARSVRSGGQKVALAEAHILATRWMNDPNRSERLLRYAAEFTGRSEDVVSLALDNIKYDEAPNVQGLRDYYAQLEQYHLLKKTPQDLGFADREAFFEDYIDQETFDLAKRRADTGAQRSRSDPAVGRGKVRITYIAGDLHHLAHFVSKKEGFYERAGFTLGKNLIEVPPYPNGAAIMEAIKNGDVDAAYLGGAPAMLKRINDDTKIGVIAGVNDIGSSLVVRKDGRIERSEDLAGHTIAVPAPGTVQDVLLRRLLAKLGLTYRLRQ